MPTRDGRKRKAARNGGEFLFLPLPIIDIGPSCRFNHRAFERFKRFRQHVKEIALHDHLSDYRLAFDEMNYPLGLVSGTISR